MSARRSRFRYADLPVSVVYQFPDAPISYGECLKEFVVWQRVLNPSALYAQCSVLQYLIRKDILRNAPKQYSGIVEQLSRNLYMWTVVNI